jgi:hypothetical protein
MFLSPRKTVFPRISPQTPEVTHSRVETKLGVGPDFFQDWVGLAGQSCLTRWGGQSRRAQGSSGSLLPLPGRDLSPQSLLSPLTMPCLFPWGSWEIR